MEKEEKNFILIGPKSSGKSSICEKLLLFNSGDTNSMSHPKETKSVQVVKKSDELTLVDCPGWVNNDSNEFNLDEIYKKLCDEKIGEKKFKFLLCTRDDSPNFVNFCEKLVEKFGGADVVRCLVLVVIPLEKCPPDTSLYSFANISKGYECLRKFNQPPFVLWDNRSGWFPNQMDALWDRASRVECYQFESNNDEHQTAGSNQSENDRESKLFLKYLV